MIVPTNRAILFAALVTLPFGALAATVAHAQAASFSAIGALFLVGALDAVAARRRLPGVEVALPGLLRMQKDRESEIELRIRNGLGCALRLRLGLALPEEFESLEEDIHTSVKAEAEESLLNWKCVPRKRGRFFLEAAFLETRSPLGLWDARMRCPARTELRVYPNLLDERRNVSALFLARGHGGMRVQRQVGKGREFEKLREYVRGDSYEDIHWKATAKRGHPVTKVYQIERTQEVYVIVDHSRLTARRSGETDTVLERFVTASLILGMAAQQQGDLYGLVTFSDRVQSFLRARNGPAHYHACRDALYTVQPQRVTPDFDELAAFVRLRLRKRSLLIILTALDDPVLAESFTRNMELICRQHLILVNMIQPPGTGPVFGDADVADLDDVYSRLGGHVRWQKLRELEKALQRRGMRFGLLQDERLAAELVTQYLDVKARQLV